MRFFLFLLFPFLSLYALDFEQAALELVNAGVFCNRLKVCPGICGSFSRRLHGHRIAITAGCRHKSELTYEDILLFDLKGPKPLCPKKWCDDVALHTCLFQFSDDICAIIHTHSVASIVLSKLLAPQTCLITEGYNLHKIFLGPCHCPSRLEIPIFEDCQDIEALACEVASCLRKKRNIYGFFIRGHGFYTWGCDMKEARLRVEAFEKLFECELLLRCSCP